MIDDIVSKGLIYLSTTHKYIVPASGFTKKMTTHHISTYMGQERIKIEACLKENTSMP
jgi:hypothetical protein